MEKEKYPIIENGFVDKQGIYYSNIRNVAFNSNCVPYNFGPCVAATSNVFILKSSYDDKKALKIDTNFSCFPYLGRMDTRVVSFLQSKQSVISLTDFPTGIVSIDGFIIGQEIPYYKDLIDLSDFMEKPEFKDKAFDLVDKSCEILDELYKNDISYRDCHSGNFLTNGEELKLIDFDNMAVSEISHEKVSILGIGSDWMMKNTISNLRNMVNNMYLHVGQEEEFDRNLLDVHNLDDMRNYNEIKKKVLKR